MLAFQCSQDGESCSPRQDPGGGAELPRTWGRGAAGVGWCLRESAGSVQSTSVSGAPAFHLYNPYPLLAIKVFVTFSFL